jgi:hypothetical protein
MLTRIQRRGLIAGAALAWCSRRAGATEPAGQVQSSRGDCYAQSAAARRDIAPPASVFVGDLVGTGVESALGLHLGTATEVKLGAEARLRIDRFVVNAGGVLMLERGALLYDHDDQSGASDVTVRSRYGLVAVRGTRFFAGPSNGVFGVFVARGEVTVVGVYTAVVLAAGEGTNIAQPGAEPTPPAKWGQPRVDAAMASVR